MRLPLLLLVFLFVACQSSPPVAESSAPVTEVAISPTTVADTLPPAPPPVRPPDYDTTQWTEVIRLDSSLVLDIRYATANNFMDTVIYDCPRCLLRPKVARAIVAAQADLKEQGLGFKLFDCYRPGPYQQRLWDVMPDPRYVADPKKGSVHGRGAAVDLTLMDLQTGEQLEMGTTYDFFGPEAYPAYTELPDTVLANRRLLSRTLQRHGFAPIRTEWWHFNFRGPRFQLDDYLWNCEN